MRLTIGTRGSQLALIQAESVRDQLLAQHTGLEIRLEVIRTLGDRTRGSLRRFGGRGVFTSELQAALLDGRIHLAVHSLKDLPTTGPPQLVLVATPPREDVRDVLVAQRACSLDELPPGATVGTGSPRRQAQLLALRPDLRPVDLRGNLDTRITRVTDGELDAVVLAAAGLHRLGWAGRISAYLQPEQMLPAPGQAALGLQMRADADQAPLVQALNHPHTFQAVTAERALLAALGGGCHAPMGAWGRIRAGMLLLSGAVGNPDGSRVVRRICRGAPEAAAALGHRLAAALRAAGAEPMLAERPAP